MSPQRLARIVPLLVGEPLHVLVKRISRVVLSRGIVERGWLPAAERLGQSGHDRPPW